MTVPIFHLSQRIWKKIFESMGNEITKFKSKLKNSDEKLSDSEIKKRANARKKELKEEMKKYMDVFMELFN